MKKTITPFTAQLVTFDTTLPVREVITRLDKAVNKSGSAQFISRFKTITSKAEIEELVQNVLGDNDFLYVIISKMQLQSKV
jgi:D-ribose pyranose/furanose isomerase RbsD